MSLWNRWRHKREQDKAGRKAAMEVHDRVVDHLLVLSGDGSLGLDDGYELRFELMVFYASNILFEFRDDAVFTQDFWEIVFEGFQESLRMRGVTDIRMAARMKKTLQNATGRRNVYVAAWESDDAVELRRAIARNILNGAKEDDERIDRILASLEGLPGLVDLQ